jgi:peptidoglycan/xylan/chitin deacetylase (PgdA/CDA1 family)
MRYLDRHRFHVVTLQEVYDYWHGTPLPRRPIVVSFDDGFAGQYREAMPILAAHAWAGTLNLAVSHYPNELSKPRILALLRHGWELDSHTLTHAYLPRLAGSALEREVAGSRRFLRRAFHVPVNFFCYPSGAFNAAVVGAVRRAGYLGATTTEFGLAARAEPYTLDRVRVWRADGVAGLARKLAALGVDG